MTKPLFQKYCHICKFPHIYGSIFFRMPAFLSGKLFHSCRLLGLMQAIHTSAVRCCFCRIECHFSQNCCCDIFLFAAYHITHLQFHFQYQYTFFCRLFLFNVEIPTQHVIFPLRSRPYQYLTCIFVVLPLYEYLVYILELLAYFSCLCKILLERKLYIWQKIVFVNYAKT